MWSVKDFARETYFRKSSKADERSIWFSKGLNKSVAHWSLLWSAPLRTFVTLPSVVSTKPCYSQSTTFRPSSRKISKYAQGTSNRRLTVAHLPFVSSRSSYAFYECELYFFVPAAAWIFCSVAIWFNSVLKRYVWPLSQAQTLTVYVYRDHQNQY